MPIIAHLFAPIALVLPAATVDVTSDESVSALVSRIISEQGCIDVVINNAGTE